MADYGNKTKNEIENYYKARILSKDIPLSITWFITWMCNYKCPYCWERVDDAIYRKSIMKINEVEPKEWADAFNRLLPSEIYFTGGEPTLYRYLPEMMELLDNSIKFKMTSNFGRSFDVEKYADHVLKKKFSVIGLSFHPSEVSLDEFLHKFDRILELGFNESTDLGIELVLYPEDIKYAYELLSYGEKNNVKIILDEYVDPRKSYSYTKKLKEEVNELRGRARVLERQSREHRQRSESYRIISGNDFSFGDDVVIYGAGRACNELLSKISVGEKSKIKAVIDKNREGEVIFENICISNINYAVANNKNAKYIITVQRKDLISEISIALGILGISPERIYIYQEDIKKEEPIKRGNHDIWCPAGIGTMCIDPNGDAYPCLRALTNCKEGIVTEQSIRKKIGNILEQTISYQDDVLLCKESYNCSACDYQLIEKYMVNA